MVGVVLLRYFVPRMRDRSRAMSEVLRHQVRAGLDAEQLADPFERFTRVFARAKEADPKDFNAMCLSTVDDDGRPSSRFVLLKEFDARGFVFYTNLESRKGRELELNPRATAVFPWIALERQVIIEGAMARVAREESETYFHSRPRASQLAAWGPPQSSIIPGRAQLEESFKAVERRYEGQEVPLPPHWGGWRLSPETVEFWQGRRSRLHDRLRYRRQQDGWTVERLAP